MNSDMESNRLKGCLETDEDLFSQESRKLKKDSTLCTSERVDNFQKNFNQMKLEIHQKLELCKTIDKENIADHFDNMMLDLQKLQKYLADSNEFLPSYVIRTSTVNLKEIQEFIETQQSEFLPKKKFAFKSRIKGNQKTDKVISSDVVSEEVDSVLSKSVPSYDFSNKTGQLLQKNSEELLGKDIEINNLVDCTVLLMGTPNTVHFSKLKNCKLFLGPVKTSVFIDKCMSCIFVAACQQLRVHNTEKSDFYLHIISNPIIEDCTEVRFAPYAMEYKSLNDHFSLSGLDKNVNKWESVNDFNWLALNAQSPNWLIIPVEERCSWSF